MNFSVGPTPVLTQAIVFVKNSEKEKDREKNNLKK
jgi:hypothetical protein